MADPAALGAAMLAALREHTASNDSTAPQWRRIEAEAVARGFPSTRAFRAWCFARGVEVRETTLRDTWVRPADVDRAVEAMPAARKPKAKPGPAHEFDDDIKGRR